MQKPSHIINLELFLQDVYSRQGGTGTSATSVTSDSVSVQISNATAGLGNPADIDRLSNGISALSQAVSVLSQQVSVLSAGLGGVQMRVASNLQGISATALANISGLSASVASTAVYQLDGQILYRVSVANTVGFGLTFPVGVVATGRMEGNISVGMGFVASVDTVGYFDEAGSGSIIYSVTPTGTGTLGVRFEALFQTSTTAGTIQLQARTSAAGSPVNIQRGSYLRAYKIG